MTSSAARQPTLYGRSHTFRNRQVDRNHARRRPWLALEELERREMLTASNLFFPSPIEFPSQDLQQPPVISSRNGVLEASANMVKAGVADSPVLYGGQPLLSGGTSNDPAYAMVYQFNAYGQSFPAAFPGVTLQLNPGDTLKLHIENDLTNPNDPSASDFASNWHFHGGHVPSYGEADNVYRTINPGDSMDVEIPMPVKEQTGGLNWYHPHHHETTASQVYGGLAGMIEVGDVLDPWPQLKGQVQEVTMGLSEVNIHNGRLQPLADLRTGTNFTDGWQKRVNGQENPTIHIRPGETQIWNLGSIGSRGLYNFAITDSNLQNPWQGTILGKDGNEAFVHPLAVTLSADSNRMADVLTPLAIPTGGRMSLAVTAPLTPGTYYLIDGAAGEENAGTSSDDTQQYYVVATIVVDGAPVTTPPPVFTNQLTSPLFNEAPDVTRNINFDLYGATPAEQAANALLDVFAINGALFGGGVLAQLEIGTVEEWTITNNTPLNHPFHIHQGKFIVTKINGQPVNPDVPAGSLSYVSPMDVVMVPSGKSVTVRFEVENWPGNYVFHCHILVHEDAGMMAPIRQIGPTSGERVAVSDLAPSMNPTVRVLDGKTNTVTVTQPFARYRGSIVAASTFDRAQYVQTLALGTGRKSALVKIYKNGAPVASTTFRAFTGAAANGVSLAMGALSTNGTAVVAAGSRGRGAVVRLFDTDGKLLREFKNVLPGRFPNGVNVAIGDVNGDNFDDLIISGRAGGAPVVTAIDGQQIATGVAVPKHLFTFTAGGGSRAGAKVAIGYVAPSTTPSYLPDIVTTAESGRSAGTVQVWNAADFLDLGAHGHMAGMVHHAMDMPPAPITEFRPFGAQPGAVDLTTTYETQTGRPALPVIASWQTNRAVAFTAISQANQTSTQVRRYS